LLGTLFFHCPLPLCAARVACSVVATLVSPEEWTWRYSPSPVFFFTQEKAQPLASFTNLTLFLFFYFFFEKLVLKPFSSFKDLPQSWSR
jgi:hypothetical protein